MNHNVNTQSGEKNTRINERLQFLKRGAKTLAIVLAAAGITMAGAKAASTLSEAQQPTATSKPLNPDEEEINNDETGERIVERTLNNTHFSYTVSPDGRVRYGMITVDGETVVWQDEEGVPEENAERVLREAYHHRNIGNQP